MVFLTPLLQLQRYQMTHNKREPQQDQQFVVPIFSPRPIKDHITNPNWTRRIEELNQGAQPLDILTAGTTREILNSAVVPEALHHIKTVHRQVRLVHGLREAAHSARF